MSNKKIAYAILAIAVAANVALAVGFKLYFFKPPTLVALSGSVSPTQSIADMPLSSVEPPGTFI